MDYYPKYLKYKAKYLALKQQIGGNPFRVIRNTGSNPSGSLTNQCMWFSIRDFLNLNGHPGITVETIRAEAGLGADTAHMMFDIVNPVFSTALQRICNRYNIRVRVFPVTYEGKLSAQWYEADEEFPDPAFSIEPTNGAPYASIKDVNVAQYGLGHFNLIVGGYSFPDMAGVAGEAFVAAIPVKESGSKEHILKEVTKLTEVESVTAALYKEMFELVNLRDFLNLDIQKNRIQLEQKKANYEETKSSKDIGEEDKKIIMLSIMTHEISPLEQLNKSFETKVASLNKEINELQAEIKAIEK